MARFTTVWALAALLVAAGPGAAAIVTLQPGPEGKDTYIASDLPDDNFGGNASIRVSSTGSGLSFSLIEFDLGPIPAGSTVNSATLSLHTDVTGAGTARFDVFRVTSPWEEFTVTYNSAPGHFSTPAAFFDDVWALTGWFDWSVTDLAQGWVDGTFANHGMWLKVTPTGFALTKTTSFLSSDTLREGDSLRPKLTIDYTPPAVPEPAAVVVWSLLGGLAAAALSRRRTRAA